MARLICGIRLLNGLSVAAAYPKPTRLRSQTDPKPEMPHSAIDLDRAAERVPDFWSPRIVAELNDYQVKVARLKGEFVWHKHDETDELFLCLSGELVIQFRDGDVTLTSGQMYIVRKGVEHRPVAAEECRVLLIEPRGVVNTGNAGGDMTAPEDVWL